MTPEEPDFDWTTRRSDRKPQLHHSNIDLLGRCGVAFEFRHIKKIRFSPPSAIHVGRGVDVAANMNLTAKIEDGELLPVEHVLDIARDATRESFEKEGVRIEEDEPADPVAVCDLAVDKAVRLANAHARVLAPTLKPKAVQQDWTIEIPGIAYDIVGQRDLDEINGTVRDLKTSKKSPSRDAAYNSDQGTLYALSRWVINRDPLPISFALDYIVDLKAGPKVVVQTSERHESDLLVMANRIEKAVDIIQSGKFTPARQTDWWCSEKYCAYAGMCRYYRRPVSVAITGETKGDEL